MVRANKCLQTNPSLSKKLKHDAKNCLLGAISIYTGHVPSHISLGKLYHSDGNLRMAEKMFRFIKGNLAKFVFKNFIYLLRKKNDEKFNWDSLRTLMDRIK